MRPYHSFSPYSCGRRLYINGEEVLEITDDEIVAYVESRRDVWINNVEIKNDMLERIRRYYCIRCGVSSCKKLFENTKARKLHLWKVHSH